MLIHAIENCIASIDEVSALREKKLSIDAFDSAVKKLTDVEDNVNLFVTTAEAMYQHDFCRVTFTADEVADFQDSIVGCAAATNQLALSAGDVNNLAKVFQAKYGQLVIRWNQDAKDYVRPIRSYLNVIQFLLDNQDEATSLSSCLEKGAKAEPTPAIVNTLVANVQKANALTCNFQMSDSVRSFLNKTKNNSATLADITPEVRNWIAEHNLDRKIKLTF